MIDSLATQRCLFTHGSLQFLLRACWWKSGRKKDDVFHASQTRLIRWPFTRSSLYCEGCPGSHPVVREEVVNELGEKKIADRKAMVEMLVHVTQEIWVLATMMDANLCLSAPDPR